MKQGSNQDTPLKKRLRLSEFFDLQLADVLSKKILVREKNFCPKSFKKEISRKIANRSYSQRVYIFAETLHAFLPSDFQAAIQILMKIMGPENPHETGMFSKFFWLLPVGKFIEMYGIHDFEASIEAIAELTKRTTGEYALRPFAEKYPSQTLQVCRTWALSENFHLRRLASEGLRPLLPWAKRLRVWENNPQVMLDLLELLKGDAVKFVQRSVANHVRDWLKLKPEQTILRLKEWQKSPNPQTQWIIRYATRK